jgi:7-carboxy-7-deazaguanine synthase
VTAWAAKADESWEEARGRRLRVAETFVSIQGESSLAGLPTAFVRLTGCALRCRWCDTAFAFHEGAWTTLEEIERWIEGTGLTRVCVTGGEPLLQPSVVPLLRRLVERGWPVSLETGGDQDVSVVPPGVKRIVDVKLPGSGMEARMDPENLERLEDDDEVKLVVADRRDYEAARELVRGALRGFSGEILVGAVHGELEPGRLAAWVIEDRLPVRVQLQLHKLLWPGRERGV